MSVHSWLTSCGLVDDKFADLLQKQKHSARTTLHQKKKPLSYKYLSY